MSSPRTCAASTVRTAIRPTTTIDDYAADVIDLLDGLHIDEAVIGGLSMGGCVAFALLRHARQLRSCA